MRHILTLAACVLAAPAVAQDLPDLGQFTAGISGNVTASGKIGINYDRAPIFVSDGSVYDAQFALDRETLKAMAGCEQSNMFMADGLCDAEVDAEVQVEGSNVVLTIFAVRNLKHVTE